MKLPAFWTIFCVCVHGLGSFVVSLFQVSMFWFHLFEQLNSFAKKHRLNRAWSYQCGTNWFNQWDIKAGGLEIQKKTKQMGRLQWFNRWFLGQSQGVCQDVAPNRYLLWRYVRYPPVPYGWWFRTPPKNHLTCMKPWKIMELTTNLNISSIDSSSLPFFPASL